MLETKWLALEAAEHSEVREEALRYRATSTVIPLHALEKASSPC